MTADSILTRVEISADYIDRCYFNWLLVLTPSQPRRSYQGGSNVIQKVKVKVKIEATIVRELCIQTNDKHISI